MNEFPEFSSGDTITVYYKKLKKETKKELSTLKELFYKEEEVERLKLLLFVKCQEELSRENFSNQFSNFRKN